jgi:hypothetical protein
MEQTNINQKTGLELLREPFDDSLISKLPKPTKAQTDAPMNEKIKCKICGSFHHPNVVHLDYVGWATVVDRLLKVDPAWNWKPIPFGNLQAGEVDEDGGFWIEVTILGLTRIGYGDSGGKKGANATKERVGDAIRNACAKFGVALDLWSKVDLHPEEPDYPISLEQSSLIADELLANDVKPEVFCAKANIRSVSELPSSKFEDAFKWIAIRAAQQKERSANPKQHNQPNKPPGSLLE